MGFPVTRMRRLRMKEPLRRMVREFRVSKKDLIYPLFVRPGKGLKIVIDSMPGNYQYSVDTLVEECNEVYNLGIPAVILFGIPETKNEMGSSAYDDNGIVQKSIREIKKKVPELIVIADVCLCEYTDHGHCGLIKNGMIDNDSTIDALAREALSYAKSGVDIVAPSDMMDGRVKKIRESLDENGYENIPIMAYSAKYSSAFYGPFREAAESAPKFGDRKSYQMDYSNIREAVREVELDIIEGADIVMVKPALSYLDVISKVRSKFNLPVAAYNVSGEYSMIKAAERNGWINGEDVMVEILTSIKRAGADLILTYFAKDVAKLIDKKII